MSEHDTNKMKDSRTFEERVFLRFDAMDTRFNAMDTRFERIDTRLDSIDSRVEKLEAKQYDTKPIWEQALAAISGVSARLDETNSRLDETNSRLDARIDQTNTRLDQGFEQLRSEMKVAFANQQQQTEHLVRDVFWQMEALNKSILEIRADQQYFHARLRNVETSIKQS